MKAETTIIKVKRDSRYLELGQILNCSIRDKMELEVFNIVIIILCQLWYMFDVYFRHFVHDQLLKI